MKQIVTCSFIALGLSIAFMSCNGDEKKTDSTTTSDTAVLASTPTEMPAAKADDMDAVKMAPGLYKVLSDTGGIRILEVNYKPGDSSAMHSHPDNVLYVINGGKGEFTAKDGSKRVIDLKAGMISRRPAESHAVKNVGTTTLKAILVEVNRPNMAGPAMDAAMDATKVSPAQYKVAVADSMGIRVLMTTYKPGESSGMHSHPTQAVYVIEGSDAEFTDKDGTKHPMKMEKGSTMIIPGMTSHATKNTGKTTMKALIVEVNRP
ncbi:MAG: cupin domain-containing protein [Ferruginibacter sp.]